MAAFFDSNVILYSVGSDPRKADISDALLKAGGWVSVQVLNEVANVSRRKMAHDWGQTHQLLRSITGAADVLDLTRDVHVMGLRICEYHKLSLYDSMIVAAALTAGCDILYSEDLHDGLVIDGRLTVRNPFGQAAG